MSTVVESTSGEVNGSLDDPIDMTIRENVVFLGETLGPFFLADPTGESIQPAFAAISALDVEAAAQDWPFVDDSIALDCLKRMQQDIRIKAGATFDSASDEPLIWEYRRLFVGPAPKPAPPWGSVYTDWEMVVFGESTLALRQWMRENGIERLAGEGTPEDHIGLMLLLMSWIAENKPELLSEYLRFHLLTWSSHFLEQLEKAAEHSFYAGLARLTRESLEGVQRDLQIDVEYPRYYR